MRNLKGFNTYQEDNIITIENEYGEEYTMYDNGLEELLPEAFYEYVQDQMSSFYQN